MATRRALQALQNAINNLETFANEPGCEWCQDKADELRTAVEELHDVLPIAEEMKQKVDTLARQNIGAVRRDILEAKTVLSSSEPAELAASPLLRQAGGRSSETESFNSPGVSDPAVSSVSVFDRGTFQEAKEFFKVRPVLRDMLGGLKERKKDRFRLFGGI
jgi:hypothetical protein